MKPVVSAILFGMMVPVTPACAAVVLESDTLKSEMTVSYLTDHSASGWAVVPRTENKVSNNAANVLGDTLATYAAMLPEPSDWILLVIGFGVIGYAMRSRKRAHVSFN